MTIIFIYFADSPSCNVIPSVNKPKEECRKWLLDLCTKFVHTYLLEEETVLPIISSINDLNESRKSGYICRFEGCHSKYILHSARVK